MSNVLHFEVHKNRLRRVDGYAPVSGEVGYSQIVCRFIGNDWNGVAEVNAGFYVTRKSILRVDAAIVTADGAKTATFAVPPTLLDVNEKVYFGVRCSQQSGNDTIVIATNVVAIDVATGITGNLDNEAEIEASIVAQYEAAWNAAISQNTAAIAVNAAAITQNSADIAGNTASIGTNAAGIAANAADIDVLEGRVGTNETNISNLSGTVAANSATIQQHSAAISARDSAIAQHTANIAAHTAAIGANAANIAANTAGIAANAAAIAGKATTSEVVSLLGGYQETNDKAQEVNLHTTGVTDEILYPSVAAAKGLAHEALLERWHAVSYGEYALYSEYDKADIYDYLNDSEYTDYDTADPYASTKVTAQGDAIDDDDDKPPAPDVELPAGVSEIYLFDAGTGEDRVVSMLINLVPGHRYLYVAKNSSGAVLAAGGLKVTGQVRMIDATCGTAARAPFNVRDIGGWACDGGRLKYGMIFRGSELNVNVGGTSLGNGKYTVNAAQIALFKHTLGVRDEIDLRGASGAQDSAAAITDTALGTGVGYVKVPIGYQQYSFSQTDLYASIIKRIAKDIRENKPMYIHCTSGADRTAQVIMLIEALCGVGLNDIDRDYELTSYSKKSYSGNPRNYRSRISGSDGTWKAWMLCFLNNNELSGNNIRDKVIDYLLKAGVTAEEINTIRFGLIDGDPGKIETPYTEPDVNDIRFVTIPGTSPDAVDLCTDPHTVYRVYVACDLVTHDHINVICTQRVTGGVVTKYTQYAYSNTGYILVRKSTSVTNGVIVWGSWGYFPTAEKIAADYYNKTQVDTALGGKADKAELPTKTSDLTNDSGFLTSHQSLSNYYNKAEINTMIGNIESLLAQV